MNMRDRYPNKRFRMRGLGGKFRKATMEDIGIGGVCPKCNHFLIQHYNGDPRDAFPDPRKFVYRCFTCEPLTDAEKALAAEIEAAKPKPEGILAFLKRAMDEADAKKGVE